MRKTLLILTFVVLWLNVSAQENVNSSRKKIEFYEPVHDTVLNVHEIEIDSKKLILEILFYSLNDSLVPKYAVYENVETGRLTDSVTIMTHNNQGKIIIKQGDSVILSELIDKTILKDTLPNNFFEESTIWHLQFDRVENGKIHFSSMIGPPDSDWIGYVNFMIGLIEKKLGFYFPVESEEE